MAKQKSGGAQLIARGKKPITLGVSPEDKKTLDDAAKAEGRPTTQFVLYHALQAAKKVLATAHETSPSK